MTSSSPGTSLVGGSATTDPNGHGTAMAGIIAAETGNGTGIAGIGFAGVSIMPVTVLDEQGLGQDSDIIEGIVWAVDHGADVINMSFSNPGFSPALQAAIDYAWANDVVLVAATGNDASSTVTYPAGDRGVIGVSSTDQSDTLAGSSNYGESVFLAAPGVGILTTSPGGGTSLVSGTSAVRGGGLGGRGAASCRGSGCLERGHRRATRPVGGAGWRCLGSGERAPRPGAGPRRLRHRRDPAEMAPARSATAARSSARTSRRTLAHLS